MDNQLWTKTEVAERLNVSTRTIERLIAGGDPTFPQPLRIARATRWRPEQVEAWIRQREQRERYIASSRA